MTDPLPNKSAHDANHCMFLGLLQEMEAMHMVKSMYGSTEDHWKNMRQALHWGATPLQGSFIRMNDKWSRLQSLWQRPDEGHYDESMEDTLLDLAAYALINICLMRESKPQFTPPILENK